MKIGPMRLVKLLAVLATVTTMAVVAAVGAQADPGANLEVILRPVGAVSNSGFGTSPNFSTKISISGTAVRWTNCSKSIAST